MAAGRAGDAWASLLIDFDSHMAVRQLTTSTREHYARGLRSLIASMQASGLETLADARAREIEVWQASRAGLAPSTRKIEATAAQQFLLWCEQHGHDTRELRLALVFPKIPRRLPRPLGPHDLARLKVYFQSRPGSLRIARDRALFWFLYSSGARISEALSVDRDAYQDGVVRVWQKGGSEKMLVTSAQAQGAVVDYLARRVDDCPALFVGFARSVTRAGRLTRSGTEGIWRRVADEIGIAHFTNHQLRHSCGTDLWRSTHDVLLVADHLGHRSLESSRGYIKLDLEARRQAVEGLGNQNSAPKPNIRSAEREA